MRDPARIPALLDILRMVWQAHPDLRFGQLVDNIGVDFQTEDEDFIGAVRGFIRAHPDDHSKEALKAIDTYLIDAAANEVPIRFDSLGALLSDLNDESEEDPTRPDSNSELFTPMNVRGKPFETLRQMRDEERY